MLHVHVSCFIWINHVCAKLHMSEPCQWVSFWSFWHTHIILMSWLIKCIWISHIVVMFHMSESCRWASFWSFWHTHIILMSWPIKCNVHMNASCYMCTCHVSYELIMSAPCFTWVHMNLSCYSLSSMLHMSESWIQHDQYAPCVDMTNMLHASTWLICAMLHMSESWICHVISISHVDEVMFHVN